MKRDHGWRAPHARLVAVALFVASGCSARVDWSLRFEGVVERPGSFYEVRFQRDCAPDAEVFAQRILREGTMPEALSLSATEAAVFVTAFDARCHAYARGCERVAQDAPRASVALAPFDEDRCALGACPLLDRCGGSDAGFDAGSGDAGFDAGPADAGVDAPVDADVRDVPEDVPPPRPECEVLREEGAWACDDFESGRDPAVQWRVAGAGTIDWLPAPERLGRTATQMRTTNDRDGSSLRVANIPAGATEVWARISTYFPPESAARFDLAYLWGGEGDRGISVALDATRQVGFWLGSETPDYWDHYAAPALPSGWSCLELGFVVHETSGRVDVYRDGTPVRSIVGRGTVSPNGPYQALHLGVVTAYETPTTLYIDDIAVGPRRIPCP